jgi:hypothetical protein
MSERVGQWGEVNVSREPRFDCSRIESLGDDAIRVRARFSIDSDVLRKDGKAAHRDDSFTSRYLMRQCFLVRRIW